jgi:hypothetical protein
MELEKLHSDQLTILIIHVSVSLSVNWTPSSCVTNIEDHPLSTHSVICTTKSSDLPAVFLFVLLFQLYNILECMPFFQLMVNLVE